MLVVVLVFTEAVVMFGFQDKMLNAGPDSTNGATLNSPKHSKRVVWDNRLRVVVLASSA